MDKEKFLSSGLIDLYVLGLASPKDAETVRKYAEKFPDIKSMIDSLSLSLENYAVANSVPPPPDLRDRTFNEIDKIITDSKPDSSSESQTGGISGSQIGLGILVLLCAGLAYLFFKNQNQVSQLQSQLISSENALEDCRQNQNQINSVNQIFALQNQFLKNNKTVHIPLRGSDLAPQSLAVAYWNEEEDYAYLNILDLPEPVSGKVYQMWADIEGEMVDMGVLNYEKDKLIEIPYMAHAESLNITLENSGGAKSPTVTQIYMSGKII